MHALNRKHNYDSHETNIYNHCTTLFFCFILGDAVPPDTTLVFDLVLLDIFNRADQVQTKVISTPKDCRRSVMRTDFVRFHFNGTLLDGTVFDSRLVSEETHINKTTKCHLQRGFTNTPLSTPYLFAPETSL